MRADVDEGCLLGQGDRGFAGVTGIYRPAFLWRGTIRSLLDEEMVITGRNEKRGHKMSLCLVKFL